MRSVLVLGGTAEARELAAALDRDPQTRVISTLAGRVVRPRLPAGEVRIGGFGGADGLARYLQDEQIGAVVDATHPFAERMSASAYSACERAGVPLVRVERPPFAQAADDDWRRVATLDEAARLIPTVGRRVFLTTGRQGLAAFAGVDDAFFLVRCVDPPRAPLPRHHELLLRRGPFTLDGELKLIDRHRLDVLVTKDSGGEHTQAKIDAARMRRLPVIVVARPARPGGRAIPTVADAGEALDWLRRHDAG